MCKAVGTPNIRGTEASPGLRWELVTPASCVSVQGAERSGSVTRGLEADLLGTRGGGEDGFQGERAN